MRLRARIAEEVEALEAEYSAVMERFPESRESLADLAAEHGDHAQALRGPAAARSRSPSRSPSPSPSPFPSASSAARAASLPEARRALAGVEVRASRRRGRQAVQAGPVLARLLASIAACEAGHAALLRQDPS